MKEHESKLELITATKKAARLSGSQFKWCAVRDSNPRRTDS